MDVPGELIGGILQLTGEPGVLAVLAYLLVDHLRLRRLVVDMSIRLLWLEQQHKRRYGEEITTNPGIVRP